MATKAKSTAIKVRKKQRGVGINFRDLMAVKDLILSEISNPVRGLFKLIVLTKNLIPNCVSLHLIGINLLIFGRLFVGLSQLSLCIQ